MVDPSGVVEGVLSAGIFSRLKRLFRIGDGGESGVDTQAEALVGKLPDQMDDKEDLKEGLRATGEYSVTKESEKERFLGSRESKRSTNKETKTVEFDMSVSLDDSS